jgi:hypothetical protein
MMWLLIGLSVLSAAMNLCLLVALVTITGLHRVTWWKAPAFPRLANLWDHSNHIDKETGVDHWEKRWDSYAGRNGRVDAAEAVTDQNRPCWGHWTDYPILEGGQKDGLRQATDADGASMFGLRQAID